MNPTDALFWALDVFPELRSTIGALVVLDAPLEREALRRELEQHSATFVRMHQRVAEVPFGLAPPEWIEDEHFDLDYHLRSIAAPAPGRLDDVLGAVGPFFATPFDRSRPLWETYLIEGLAGGKGAVFLKMHHCLTDGVGGAMLTDALLDEARPSQALDRQQTEQAPATDPLTALWRAAAYQLVEGATLTRDVAATIASSLRRPIRSSIAIVDGLRAATGFASELSAGPAESPLHQGRSMSRRLATFAIPVDDIDLVRSWTGATNNDVVLGIVSGALHRWHTSHGADVKELTALVPVNLRAEDDLRPGNRIAILAVALPVGEPDAMKRVRSIHERMLRVKSDRRATLYPVLARAMTLLPPSLALALGRQQTRRANFVCTNVPGPKRRIEIAGRTVEQIYPYAPLVGDHPVAIAVLSYLGTLYVGLDVDPLGMPDLQHFVDAVEESRAELVGICRRAAEIGPGDSIASRG